jgi:cytochrome c oxidase cbb3-type subunit 1
MYRKPLYSEGMAEWHFWLSFLGFILFSTALWIGGFMQGIEWTDPTIPFIKTVTDVEPFWHARAVGGMMMLTGMVLFAFNMYKTATVPAPALTDGQVAVASGSEAKVTA